MPIDLENAIPIAAAAELDAWLAQHGDSKREVVVAIYNKASGRQGVSLVELQEVALCHGWVDTQTRRIDTERYAVRFVPRRAGLALVAKTERWPADAGTGRITFQGSQLALGPAQLRASTRRPMSHRS